MDVDPSTNMVVFEVERGGAVDRLVGHAPTRSNNCVQTAWTQLMHEHKLAPQHVRRVYSEWEPTSEDKAFLDREFGNIEVTYSFERPRDGDWDPAFARTREIITKSLKEKAGDKSSVPLPILRDLDAYDEMVVNIPLTNKLAVYLANVGMTERGSIGINYVLHRSIVEDGIDVESLWKQAFSNLGSSLQVNAVKDVSGATTLL